MKKITSIRVLPLIILSALSNSLFAQCGPGYTQSQLNWDVLDFLPSNIANYTSWYTSSARPYSQDFSMGTRRVNFTMAPQANITLNGENATNAGDLNSFATAGQDVQFTTTSTANTTITMTFDQDVAEVKFSLFDLDNNQKVAFAASNSLSVAVPVILTNANVGSGIVIVGQVATGAGTNVGGASNAGTLNVYIVGPVKTITLTLSNATGDLWLGDINACVTGSFPANYRSVSQPFNGMPSYILTVRDNEFYLLNPATGEAKSFFTDPGWTNINGMAYDPYKRILYYTYSLRTAAPGGNAGTKSIYKYEVDNGTISTFVADVTQPPLNIPTYDPGVTSGSASFYNGSLYFGVESANSARNSGRENTVWKIDFAADSITPIRASQVYAIRSDSTIGASARLVHDWSDIGVTNGIMYDFDGAGAGTTQLDSMYYHYDLMTGQRLQFVPSGAGNIGPKQVAIDWAGNVYNMGGLPTSSANAQTIGGFIVPYNYDGTVNNAQNHLVYTAGPTYPIGSWGDCSEAFRPLCDFGDAPASYDPVALSPAVNERDTALHIGPTTQIEWLKTSSALADADPDEDGLAYTPIFNPLTGSYVVQASVYNNTGSNATLIAWLDYNGNGVFDAGEASTPVTVSSMATTQTPYLSWPSISSSLVAGTYTYLRIRMTSSSNSMTTSNATGYFSNGETEDYRVLVDNVPLAIRLLAFDATWQPGNSANITWKATEDLNSTGYMLQRSANGIQWADINFIPAQKNSSTNSYSYSDHNLNAGKNYYRLRLSENNGVSKYSDVKIVMGQGVEMIVSVTPNPVRSVANIRIDHLQTGNLVQVKLVSMTGHELYSQKIRITDASQQIDLALKDSWPDGQYILQIITDRQTTTRKIIVRK